MEGDRIYDFIRTALENDGREKYHDILVNYETWYQSSDNKQFKA